MWTQSAFYVVALIYAAGGRPNSRVNLRIGTAPANISEHVNVVSSYPNSNVWLLSEIDPLVKYLVQRTDATSDFAPSRSQYVADASVAAGIDHVSQQASDIRKPYVSQRYATEETTRYRAGNSGTVPSNASLANVVSVDPQASIWLISEDDPVPSYLNQGLPSSGFPGVQVIATLQNTTPHNSGALAQKENEYALFSNVLNANNSDQRYENIIVLEAESLNQNDQSPWPHSGRAVVVQLPPVYSTGLWERPLPSVVEILTDEKQGISSRVSTENIPKSTRILNEMEEIQSLHVYPKREEERYELENRGSSNTGRDSENGIFRNPQNFLPSNSFVITPPLEGENETDFILSDILVVEREHEGSPFEEDLNENDTIVYKIPLDELSNSRDRNIEQVLSREDIDILQRLGILPSIQIDISERDNGTFSLLPPGLGQENRLGEAQKEKLNDSVRVNSLSTAEPRYPERNYVRQLPGPENIGVTRILPLPYVVAPEISRLDKVEGPDVTVINSTQTLSDAEIVHILKYLDGGPVDLLSPMTLKDISQEVLNEQFRDAGRSEEGLSLTAKTSTNERLRTPQPTSRVADNPSTDSALYTNGFATPTPNNKSVGTPPLVPRSIARFETADRLPDRDYSENDVANVSSPTKATSRQRRRRLKKLKKIRVQPRPYDFGYDQSDGNGTRQHRQETADDKGVVKGTYGYMDPVGVFRKVNYVADQGGFRAVVHTNEPGAVSYGSADVVVLAEPPPRAALLNDGVPFDGAERGVQ